VKFESELAPIAAAIKRARTVIASRQTIPILGCVHITARDTGLRITGTNMDEWVTVQSDAAVAVPGAVCVDAGLIGAWLQTLPKGALVSASLIDNRLAVTAGRATASFAVMDAKDYPSPVTPDAGVELIDAARGLAMCLPFASSEETRYYLKGVAINRGHAVATDGHRLCSVDIGADADGAVIIPTSGVQQIVQGSPAARLWVTDTMWRCEDAGVVAGGKLIEGTFPDWTRLMPVADASGTVDADALAGAVATVSVSGDDRASCVKMVAADGEIELSCTGSAMTATGAVSYDGSPFELGINGKYADAALAVFTGRCVSIAVGEGKAVMTSDALHGVRVLVMGMRV